MSIFDILVIAVVANGGDGISSFVVLLAGAQRHVEVWLHKEPVS
jgi:hypothetical protein